MAADARVCPFCGESPGPGMFCEACGRSLSGVERLPTRAEWLAQQDVPAEDERSTAERCAAATAAFLAAMHAAGDPGLIKVPVAPGKAFGRTPKVPGWIVRRVERDDESRPRRYRPGLLLDVDGAFRQLDNELRGWGQRDFPAYHHTVGADAVPMPAEGRLVAELAAVLRDNGLADATVLA